MANHTAVKQGKAWAQSVAAQAQQWKWYSDEFEVGATRPKGIAYQSDPLAIVLMMKLFDGKSNYEIAHDIRTANTLVINNNELPQSAERIRKYYRNKLMMHVLKGGTLSQYRTDLRELVESENIYYIREDFIPMLVKLPDFYEEDTILDQLVKDYRTDARTYAKKGALDVTRTLMPIISNRRKTRNGDSVNYYFNDKENKLYKLEVGPNNPLKHLFDREFKKDQLVFKTNIAGHRIRGTDINMFYMSNWVINE
jgi:hypothetical protein